MQVCVQERKVFCSKVSTGSARVFRCLAHNLGKPDFGEACRAEIKAKLMRRQQNWKLDVTLRDNCKGDADELCAHVDHDADKAEVTRCLISHHGNLTDPCRNEARPSPPPPPSRGLITCLACRCLASREPSGPPLAPAAPLRCASGLGAAPPGHGCSCCADPDGSRVGRPAGGAGDSPSTCLARCLAREL